MRRNLNGLTKLTPYHIRMQTETLANGCIVWQGAKDRNGYGQIKLAGKMRMTHKLWYEQNVRPLAEGKELDHLCKNRACLNPAHLEPVSRSENMARQWADRRNANGSETTPEL